MENPGLEVHQVVGYPRDGGIDVLVVDQDGLDIYQCKYLRDTLKDTQWKQIRDSFETALKKNTNIHTWYLCLPRQLTKPEIEKITAFIHSHTECGFHIGVIDGNQLISLAVNRNKEISVLINESPHRIDNEEDV